MTNLLSIHLKAIDEMLAIAPKGEEANLNPPATPAMLKSLAETIFDDKKLPTDLETLYQWHNGQSDVGLLNPDDNLTFLPISEGLEAYAYLGKEADNWSGEGWPIFTNGGGDYVCYLIKGEKAGQLAWYLHDDDRQPHAWLSLTNWSNEVWSNLRKVMIDWQK